MRDGLQTTPSQTIMIYDYSKMTLMGVVNLNVNIFKGLVNQMTNYVGSMEVCLVGTCVLICLTKHL